MPYSPNEKLSLMVEIQINGVWIVITSRARRAGGLTIKHGRSDGAIQGEASRCGITIGNDDGYLTEGNPMSPWYPYIGRGTPIRVSLADVLASPARRFTGEIDEIDMAFPGSGTCVVRVEALGTLAVIAQNSVALRSPLYRSIAGIAAGDYIPYAYWPMEDDSSATQVAATAASVAAGSVTGSVTFAAVADLPGSEPLPQLATGAHIVMSVPSYTSTGQWAVQVLAKVTSAPASPTTLIELHTNGEGTNSKYRVVLEPGSPDQLVLYATDATTGVESNYNVAVLDGSHVSRFPTEADFYGSWRMYKMAENITAGSIIGWMSISNATFAGVSGGGLVGGSTSTLRSVTVYAESGTSGIAFGHTAVYVDPTLAISTELGDNAAALDGWAGEEAHERVERLCREENLPAVIYGSSSSAMGPQRLASLFDLLLDCERADQGYLFDAVDEIAVAYRTRENLYNQVPSIAITKGALTDSLTPRWNNQQVANDWTVHRYGGSSARASDESHVTATRRRSIQSLTVNLETDDVLADHASWRLAIGTAPGPRYTEGAINMRNDDGALLADDVLALKPGDRITATSAALPSQHPPGGFNQMVIGWTEELDSREWLLHPNLIPSQPYHQIGVYGTDAANSRYDSDASTLAASYTATATSFSVATTTGHALWQVGSGAGFEFDIEVAGIRITVTAVSGASSPQTFTVRRSVDGYDKALSSGEQVRLFDPSRYGL